jgi:hypothetical protein
MLSWPQWSGRVSDVHHPIFKFPEGYTGPADHGAFANHASRAHESIGRYPGESPNSDGSCYEGEIGIIDVVGARAEMNVLGYQRPLSEPDRGLVVAFYAMRD